MEQTADNTTDVAEAEPPLVGGRYALKTRLGEGAMGEVYEAEHVLMEKQVALKVLRGDLSDDDEAVARFQREARAAASLDHPNVCQATDFGQTTDGDFFLVMEYLEGETLQHQIDTFGSLGVERTLHIARQIADALHRAHSQGIVHRDLKPENIMLIDRQGDSDVVKIMDFGIARLVSTDDEDDEGQRLTRAGMVYGTPHYMAPEQVAGDDVDHRADLYALGVVIFEMLTGKPPFDGENIAKVMGQHITEPIPSLNDQVDAHRFPAELQAIIDALLDKDRDERLADAEDLSPLLEAAHQAHQRRQTLSNLHLNGAGDHLRDLRGQTRDIGARFKSQARDRWAALSGLQRLMVTGLAAWFVISSLVVSLGTFWWLSGGFDRPTPGERDASRLADIQQQRAADEEVEHALAALDRGDHGPMDDLIDEHPDDAHLHFLSLKHRIESDHFEPDIVDEARELLAMDERYKNDDHLVDTLVARARAGDDEARQFLLDHPSDVARLHIGDIAFRHDQSSHRLWAQNWLDDGAHMEELPDWMRHSIELRKAHGCQEHRDQIEALVATGADEALDIIEIYRAKPTRGCGTLRRRDCYDCIRDDLDDATEALGADVATE